MPWLSRYHKTAGDSIRSRGRSMEKEVGVEQNGTIDGLASQCAEDQTRELQHWILLKPMFLLDGHCTRLCKCSGPHSCPRVVSLPIFFPCLLCMLQPKARLNSLEIGAAFVPAVRLWKNGVLNRYAQFSFMPKRVEEKSVPLLAADARFAKCRASAGYLDC